MKKIYLLFFITMLGSTVFAQIQVRNEKNMILNLHPAENNVLSVKHSSNNTSSKGGTISSVEVGYVDAVYAAYGGTAAFNQFTEPIFPDSLMKINDGSNGGSNFFYGSAGFGQVLDMTSGVFGDDLGIYNVQFKSTDSYTVDSIGIPYTYTKVNPEIDTLIVTISVSTPYDDPFNPNYSISYTADATNPSTLLTSPLEYYGSTAHGYYSGLLGSNKTVIKVPLTTAETVGSFHYVPTNMAVGAGKIFSVFVEYKPAYAYTNGDLSFVFSSGTGTPTVSSLVTTLVVDKLSDPSFRAFVDNNGDPGLTTNFSSFLTMNARYVTNSNFRDSIVSPVPTVGIPFTYFISGNSTVDVNENSSSNDFAVYPNPSTGSFNVSLANANEFNMTIMDVLGNVVINKTITGNNTTVDLSNKQTGIYFVKVTSDNFVSTKRLVVTK